MPASADDQSAAHETRRRLANTVARMLPDLAERVVRAAAEAGPTTLSGGDGAAKRRAAGQALRERSTAWQRALAPSLARQASGASAARRLDLPPPGRRAQFSLVEDTAIEREIAASRLGEFMADAVAFEFTDLRARLVSLERRDDLEASDLVRPQVLAKSILEAWHEAGLEAEQWDALIEPMRAEWASLLLAVFHGLNEWLAQRGVLPEVDLRPLIRRSQYTVSVATGYHMPAGGTRMGELPTQAIGLSGAALADVGENADVVSRRVQVAQEVLSRLIEFAADHGVTAMAKVTPASAGVLPQASMPVAPLPPRTVSPRLSAAFQKAQAEAVQQWHSTEGVSMPTRRAILDEAQHQKEQFKEAAQSQDERATIEIVALLFQSILMEDRIPASMRVWFARLQIPVLRVAISEPDFFATLDHPARRLIDRMGACVMGFDAAAKTSDQALEREIKRVVQTIEAYPDTGRKVFQTVLAEFERFLEHYFEHELEASKAGVSLAQQIEQRETLAVQYTIELRKMLQDVPVQDGVREFLFHVWADVLATAAVKQGAQAEATKTLKRVAAELIWSASAKVTREDRAEVIRRLPPLLKALREGMGSAGLTSEQQDAHIETLNNALASAFTAKAAVIAADRFEELADRLESIEEFLTEHADIEFDESVMQDLSGEGGVAFDVVGEGGKEPSPAMLAWARELEVGSWFMLEGETYQGSVQLAWQGMKRQLVLFAAPTGRCLLFHHRRLAAYLQAGLIVPAQDESLSVRATRSALEKLDADPGLLAA